MSKPVKNKNKRDKEREEAKLIHIFLPHCIGRKCNRFQIFKTSCKEEACFHRQVEKVEEPDTEKVEKPET